MSKVRQPAVAGMFYPATEKKLTNDVLTYLAQADERHAPQPKALVVPHAGYIYSGPIAASAYQQLILFNDKINRVVLLGPSHRVAFSGMAVPESDYFYTPLGEIPIDKQAIQELSHLTQVIASDRAHSEEHSLEVQLPFLQVILDEFTLIPIVVGDAERHDVAEVIKQLWADEHTLIVISSDLSHYHEYFDATHLDSATSDAVVHLKPDLIGYEDACRTEERRVGREW